jgi:molybdate transport system permease protein
MDLQALWLTLRLATTTTLVLLLAGIPIAWWIVTTRARWRPLVEAATTLPLLLPPTVLGFYLLVLLGPATGFGRDTTRLLGHPIAFTFSGLVIGSVLYSLPFAVQPLAAGFRAVEPALIEQAQLLGASSFRILTRILLPLSTHSLIAAAALCFTHTIGEFGVVLMIGGDIPGATRTLSIALYDQIQDFSYASANRTSLLLIAVALIALLLLYTRRNQAGAGKSAVTPTGSPQSKPRTEPQHKGSAPGSVISQAKPETEKRPGSPHSRGPQRARFWPGGVDSKRQTPPLPELRANSTSPPPQKYRAEIAIRHHQGAFTLQANLCLTTPWTVIFGPSGAGKSTLLRILAGLTTPDQGHIQLAGRTLLETQNKKTKSQIAIPPGRRSIGFLTQQPSLFPHMSVRDNVAFGIRHLPAEPRAHRVAAMLHIFGAESLAHRRPPQLSGGESQRIALARALAPAPALLLLDEPLAGLDDTSANDILTRLLSLDLRVLYVSHDLAEIWSIPGEVILLESGRVTATGPLRTILAPRRDDLLRQLTL